MPPESRPSKTRPEPDSAALAECDRHLRYLNAQATRNKRLTYAATAAVMLSSAAIPVLLLVSTQTGAFLLGKLLPAVAAGIAALASAAAQVVRPHDRWRVFRRHHRLLEADRVAYFHSIGEYDTDERDRVLLMRVVASHRAVVDEWLQLMPETASSLAALPRPPVP
jgi:uncharacterized protein DUF4231